MEILATIPWSSIGLSGMAVLAVYLVLTGRIVPKSTLDKAEQRGDQWREAHIESERQRQEALDIARDNTTAMEKYAERVDLPTALVKALRGGQSHQEDQT